MRDALFALAALALLSAAPAPAQHVTLRFAATAGEVPLACASPLAGVGARNSTIVAEDVRFYVSDVRLVGEDGRETPVALDDDRAWQSNGVALLSWCADGRADVHDTIAGNVPPGNYRGLRFTVGIPDRLNHADATIADAPLNVTGMFWSWQDGYKFLRVDLRTLAVNGARATSWLVHLGSTACTGDGAATRCARANRPSIALGGFDWRKNVIVADLKRLLASTDVGSHARQAPMGCMMAARDECGGVAAALGLRADGSAVAAQTVFRVR
ncbi:MAG TPA: MbnP family copper-binding protein [Candidatus Limnocylindrales bacterium]|nr:MbnP family copper-binding protein [Candidatus Limnocylindrales bacterium]